MLTESAEAAGRDPRVVRQAHGDRGRAHRLRRSSSSTGPLNVDLSGGEKKRNETLQLAVLEPRFAILDELDSGLDVDALRACSRRIEAADPRAPALGVLAITHYSRLLQELKPDVVHILARGRIQATGGPELADAARGDRLRRVGHRRGAGPPGRRSTRSPIRSPDRGDPWTSSVAQPLRHNEFNAVTTSIEQVETADGRMLVRKRIGRHKPEARPSTGWPRTTRTTGTTGGVRPMPTPAPQLRASLEGTGLEIPPATVEEDEGDGSTHACGSTT